MRKEILLAALLCAGCDVSITDANDAAPVVNGATPDQAAPMAEADNRYDFEVVPEENGQPWQPSRILQAQVALDRWGFSPGVLDGKDGMSFKAALRGFQEAHKLPVTGEYDQKTAASLLEGEARPTTWRVRIPADFARGPFFTMPSDMGEKAKLPALTYRNLLEKLAERFHTTPESLIALNGPTTKVGAGTILRVPAIDNQPVADIEGDERGWGQTLASLGVAKDQPKADRVVVDKSEGVLQVFDKDDRMVAQFSVTTGSQYDPLPLGEWTIKGVARDPDYHYNPDLFWDAAATDEKAVLKPGPNGPVGVVWIDLSKDHYGIHGTPEPQSIGRSESHGCVRLTNWDAARLAQMVSTGVRVIFQA